MKKIEFAEGLELPLAFGSSPIALLAQRGRGKTRTAKRLAESFLKAGIPPIVLDPVGVWWGLRLASDGKHAGLDIPILGGFHGDEPLLPTAGKVIAEALVETRRACILDTTGFATQGEQRRFMTDFAETFYRGKMKHPSPCHLFLEEAQEWVPQMPGPDEARMLGAFQRIFGQGRNFGIGATLISLFPQMISKRVLNLAEVLIVLGLRGSHERKAIKLWMEDHEVSADEREKAFDLMQHLGFNKSTRKDGGALIWVPDMGVFGVHKIIPPTTFDSSKTPEPGEARTASEPKPLDLDDLSLAMAATIEEAKANDPAMLRAEVAKLKRELAATPTPVGVAKTERVEVQVPALKPSERKTLERVSARMEKSAAELLSAATMANAIVEELRKAMAPAAQPPAVRSSPARSVTIPPRSTTVGGELRLRAASASGAPVSIGKGERTILTAVAQHPDGVTREQLSVLTGYKRSSRDTYLQRIREMGYVETPGDRVVVTQSGIDALGPDFVPLPIGDELRAHWMAKLQGGERRIFEVVVGAHPDPVSREAIDAATNYKRSSRDTYIQRLSARKLLEIVGRGEVRASENLFGAANG